MRFLIDTHLLLWAAGEPDKLSEEATALLPGWENELFFSAASFREIAIKRGPGRADFRIAPYRFRTQLLANPLRC